VVSGQCLCGAVGYRIEGEIIASWLCHCSKCRRANGSAFQAGAVCARRDLRWLRGEGAISEYRAPSGYRRRFCTTCGSPVPLLVEGTDYAWLPMGALDGDPRARPLHHIFVGSKAPWFTIADGLPQFAEHVPRTRS
jgi:hypothetical protein